MGSLLISLVLLLALWSPSRLLGSEDSTAIQITAVVLARPYCLPNHPPRYFELQGRGFEPVHNIQFLQVATGRTSSHLQQGSAWRSAQAIILDMTVLKPFLWPESNTRLAVRITSSSYAPLSDWSPEFRLDMGAVECLAPLTRGQAGDPWADTILGQPNFTELSPFAVVDNKLFNPGGVVVDRSVSPGLLYVWDSGNNRILGLDLARCATDEADCRPQRVLGQPGFTETSGCNHDSSLQTYPNRPLASAVSLCGVPETTVSPLEHKSFATMDVDPQGNLYVPDIYNNRVLKYNTPFLTDASADQVWGQGDFAGNHCNASRNANVRPTATSLCFDVISSLSSGVDVDAAGHLWVADSGNHRVLRFPRDPHTDQISTTADLVLGQPDFTSAQHGPGLAALSAPAGVLVTADKTVYVVDAGNRRILVYAAPHTTGMTATATFGSGFTMPTAIQLDPHNAGIWVHDLGNTMLELWGWDGTVKNVIGKDVYSPGPSPRSLFVASGGGLGIDTEGHLFVARYGYRQDVLRFTLPLVPPKAGQLHQPDQYLFATPGGYNLMTQASMNSARGVALYRDQLIVADADRLMFWNNRQALTNGQAADGLIGRSSFEPVAMPPYTRIKADDGGRLWVLRDQYGVVLFELPLTHQALPRRTVVRPGQQLPLLGGGQITLGTRFDGLAPTPDGRALWLSDTFNHRVLRIRTPRTQPMVDVVLGQTAPTGSLCNQGRAKSPASTGQEVLDPTTLCTPGGVTLDRFGNVFVSDHALEMEGNFRLLEFAAPSLPPTLTTTLFAPPAMKIFPYDNAQPGVTFDVAFDSHNRMVAGYNSYGGGRFVGIYPEPLGPETNPERYLHDFASMPYAFAFDADDNLYVADLNRARVLIYQQPLAQYPPVMNPPPPPPAREPATTWLPLLSAGP